MADDWSAIPMGIPDCADHHEVMVVPLWALTEFSMLFQAVSWVKHFVSINSFFIYVVMPCKIYFIV